MTGAGVITSGGVVSGMVAELGAATGLGAIADIGAGIATVCGALGPVGWAAAGLAGVALSVNTLKNMWHHTHGVCNQSGKKISQRIHPAFI